MLTKEEIFEVLLDWNFWDKPFPSSFSRPYYEDEMMKKAASGEILILKGVRRSGKSTLLINEMKRLTASGLALRDILYVNFEDPRFNNHLTLELMERIRDVFLEFVGPAKKPVFMLDEVQNIIGWEKWVLKEYGLKQSQIYVTGSSSALLSREIGTALTGRYLDIEVFPLSFAEFLHFNSLTIRTTAERIQNRTRINQLFSRFVEQGGFPKILEIKDADVKRDLLKTYFDSILLRDIVARHQLSNYRTLEDMATFLLSNIACISSTNKLKKHFSISFDSARDYTGYLEDAFLIFELRRFDWSVKKQMANRRKFYSIDTGLSNRVSFQVGARRAQNIENIVFLELLRRKQDVFYVKTKNDLAVDFLIKKGAQVVELIQVCYSIAEETTRKREIAALRAASRELENQRSHHCTLLTMDREEKIAYEDGFEVNVRNLIEWLLD